MTLEASKHEVRRQAIAARDAVSVAERPGLAARLQDQLLALSELRAARRVLVYASRGAEVPLREGAERLLAAGVEVAVPRIVGDDLIACPFRSWDDLTPGTYGILTASAEPWTGPIDVVVAPGVAFDRACGRLGLGRGYYDRFLASRPVGFTVGVCWDAQLCDAVPMDDRDRRVDAVVTPTGVWRAPHTLARGRSAGADRA